MKREGLDVIVHLNGPFGVGKTSVAQALLERLPGSRMYDPEIVGALVRAAGSRLDDYQDDPLWRGLLVTVARELRRSFEGALIVPMTVWRHDYYEETERGLRDIDPEVLSFRLRASEPVLRERILSRDDVDASRAWRLAHLESGLEAFADARLGLEIWTDARTPPDIADEILAMVRR